MHRKLPLGQVTALQYDTLGEARTLEEECMAARRLELHVQIARDIFGWQWRNDWQAWCPPGWPARDVLKADLRGQVACVRAAWWRALWLLWRHGRPGKACHSFLSIYSRRHRDSLELALYPAWHRQCEVFSAPAAPSELARRQAVAL